MFMDANNLAVYEKARSCPTNALKPIAAGKLKGKSDINPMWRIKKLTELFGPCGVGWKISDETYWTEPGANGEVAAWCRLSLSIKSNNEWSEPIPGVGGSMLVNTERGSLATNDEAYKMAYTDALSVCCKMLGVAADVYWETDRSKYDGYHALARTPPPAQTLPPAQTQPPAQQTAPVLICADCGQQIEPKLNKGSLYGAPYIAENTQKRYGRQLCWACMMKVEGAQKNAE